ncbi:hypothetical protein GCM10011390_19970 [Aureimonas endophytica]|uniref:SGNH hydrolase-type esterase domain-containing protein n=1 Tax=Aureimonas endophytica TaxID=2027858 RepID=A0A916ZJL2_9HYPH|nr:SGNH/GDSL hydrolase family protein [Aureimonas endophytica]GGE01138.1 hypothetical protein GCM10011390_19970 [Aureimonas endophytica]
MKTSFSGYGRPKGGAIGLSAADVDETAAPGTAIGTLLPPPGSGWSFRLADDAGGMFALSGGRIVTGSAKLSHDAAPSPKLLVAATNGERANAALLRLNVRRPLAALPRPAAARIAAIGDSQIGYNNYGGVNDVAGIAANKAVSTFAYGFIEQALAIDPRFDFDSWWDAGEPGGRGIAGANQGIFGDHLTDLQGAGILGRLPAVLARRPDLLILEGGTNSLNSGDGGNGVPAGADFCIAQLNRALVLCRNEGVPVILTTLHPRGDWPAGDARYQALAQLNAWIRAQAGRNGVAGILDAESLLAPGGTLDTTLYFGDLVHLNQRGAVLVGRDRLLPLLQAAVAPGTVFNPDPTVANLLPAGQAKLQGATGTKTGAIVSGDVAAGVTVTASRNASAILCSKAIVADDLEAQVLDITPANLGGTSYGDLGITLPSATSGLPNAGSWVRAGLLLELNEVEALSMARLNVQIAQGSATKAQTFAMNGYSSEFDKPVPAGRGWWIVTKPMQIPPGETFDRLRWTLQLYWAKSAAPFRMKLSRPFLRAIADPRVAWNY